MKVLRRLLILLFRLFNKKYSGQSLDESLYYQSIEDLPAYNWDKMVYSGDLSWLMKGRIEIELLESELLSLANKWEQMKTEYFNEFGVPSSMIKYYRSVRKIIILECEYLLTKDKIKLTLANHERNLMEINDKMSKGKSYSLSEKVIIASKKLGYMVDPKKISILYFERALRNG